MKTTRLIIALFIFHCLLFTVKAQKPEIDSLENILQQHTEKDTVRINLINDFAEAAHRIDQGKSIRYTKEALELANMLNFKKGKALSLYWLGLCHFLISDYQKSLDYHQKSLYMYEALGNKLKTSNCLHNIGMIYGSQGNHPLSLEYYQKSLKINKEAGYKQEEANCLLNVGKIYYKKGNYPLSLEYYQKSLVINEETGNKNNIANCLIGIGVTYEEQDNYALALTYYQKALKISEENGFEYGKAMSLNNIGEIYREQDNYTLALIYYQRSLKILKKSENKRGMAVTMNNIGSIYYNQANYTLALDYYQKALKISKEINNKFFISDSYANLGSFYLGMFNFKKALDYTQKSLIIARENEFLNEQKRIYLQISEIYTASKNYKKALENYILYKKLNDSIFNEKNIEKITRLEYQYKFEKEKQAIELVQQKKDAITTEKLKHQKTLSIALILGFVLMTSLVLVILWSFIQKRKANNILTKQKKEIQEIFEQLQESGKRKLDFFTNISHEIRTPLTLIKSPLERILKSNNTDNAINSQLQLAINNTNKLKDLVNQILDLQKLDEHQLGLNLSDFDIVSFCTEIVSSFEGYCYQSNCKLNFESNIGQAIIKSDQRRLQSIIQNLLTNAFKFNKKGGIVEFKLEVNTKQIKLEISDTGKGIAKEHLKKLGERYYQIEESNSTIEGTGIGFAYVKELIEIMNGELDISSAINKGTKVAISLPCDEIKTQIDIPVKLQLRSREQIFDQLEKQISDDSENGQPRILIIEDNYELRLFLCDLFTPHYQVISAKDGLEGKNMALKHIPDLIISDVMMPEIRGNELCKMLKSDVNTSHITIILFTAKGAPDSIVDGYDCGADDYIIKPFDFDLLVKKVKNIISTAENARKQFNFADIEHNKTIYSDFDKKFLKDCMSIIKDNIGNSNFTVESLAESINIHRRTLLRKLNALTSKSPTDLIKHARMSYAAELIHNKKYRVNEVALMVGYEDTNYFSQVFKKHHGMSPSAYN